MWSANNDVAVGVAVLKLQSVRATMPYRNFSEVCMTRILSWLPLEEC